MKTNASYAQLARQCEDQAARMADAILECDTALANLTVHEADGVALLSPQAVNLEGAVAAIARARARLRGDALHERQPRG